MDPLLIVFFIVLFILSAFFSGSEIALMAISPHKINSLIKSKALGAKSLKIVKKDTDRLLITILIGNNLINTLTASLATSIAINFAASSGLGLNEATAIGFATGLVTIGLLIFGEILPKSIASKNATKISLLVAPIYKILMLILFPVIWIMEKIIKFFSKEKAKEIITEEEIGSFIDLGRATGGIDEDEHEKIKSILEFDDITVSEVMTPRVKIDAVSSDLTVEKVVTYYLSHTHTRLPVYDSTIDRIDFFLTGRDLLRELRLGNQNKRIGDIKLKKVLKVPLTQSISTLLETLQNAHKTMSIIVDGYGGVAGLVTIEDIIEEVFGDIRDETDEEAEEFIKVGDGYVRVESDVLLEDVLYEFDLSLEEIGLDKKEFGGETLSYLITHVLGRFPVDGEEINFDINKEGYLGKLNFKILDIENAKIGKVDVKIIAN